MNLHNTGNHLISGVALFEGLPALCQHALTQKQEYILFNISIKSIEIFIEIRYNISKGEKDLRIPHKRQAITIGRPSLSLPPKIKTNPKGVSCDGKTKTGLLPYPPIYFQQGGRAAL
ncbi:MAG: hypothetical protein FWG94_11090 [Oscillospiraceae bacterium]|nr:hypothetical protein [Oscillospiraceae bacterium]